jgi:signal peptidase I
MQTARSPGGTGVSDQDTQPVADKKPKPRKSLFQELLETLLLTLVLFGVARFSLQNFKVDGTSMVPTLLSGEYILVDKISYRFHGDLPARGDIIVFKFPQDTSRDFIKRVIGLPGDTIAIKPVGGTYHTFVNGKMLDEAYIHGPIDRAYPDDCASAKTCTPHVVPPGDLFVMGDNRNFSYDSRRWGDLPKSDIIGRALISYWPLSHLAFLPNQYSYASSHK